jgi:hypothetical protein
MIPVVIAIFILIFIHELQLSLVHESCQVEIRDGIGELLDLVDSILQAQC